ncbi:hypothetical protein IFM89_005606 [Coptis chinensis]|uniref:Uncharacterized protein n=1 Tax=Coptis chinensis TaxID=261450 RepID=A0A835IAD1_9MAGN|nr:hypothetical protein IFM89_005606 [Coptis chinensis]
MNPKLGDFDLAKLCDHRVDRQTSRHAGTLNYIAQELARTSKASTHIDVYLFGVFLTTVPNQERGLIGLAIATVGLTMEAAQHLEGGVGVSLQFSVTAYLQQQLQRDFSVLAMASSSFPLNNVEHWEREFKDHGSVHLCSIDNKKISHGEEEENATEVVRYGMVDETKAIFITPGT